MTHVSEEERVLFYDIRLFPLYLDKETNEQLALMWNLRRYIDNKGENEAYNKLIQLVSPDKQLDFVKIRQSFIDTPEKIPIQTRNGNEFPSDLFSLYRDGKLDRTVIYVLVKREVMPHWQGTHLAHLRLLLPMCYILLDWDCPKENSELNNPTVITFKGVQYNSSELFGRENLPQLAQIAHQDRRRRKALVLGCVDFALSCQSSINWRGIRNNYLLWLCLLKLWFHTTDTPTSLRRLILLTMIISYLKYLLLHNHDETKGKH